MQVEHGRRKALTTLAIAVVVIIILAAVAGVAYYYLYYSKPSSNVTLTIATWGGDWATALKQVTDQFTAQTGIKVVFSEYAGPSALVLATLKSQAPNYKIDVVLAGESVATRAANSGFTIPLAANSIANMANIPVAYQGKVNGSVYYLGIYGIADVIGYNKQKVPAPTSIKSLLDPVYKGKIALPAPDFSPGEMLVQFALANGGNISNIQPGLDFAKQLATSGNLAYIYPDGATARNLMTTGQADVFWEISSDLYTLNQSGFPIGMVSHFSDSPTIVTSDTVSVVNGPNKDAALQFVNFFLNPTSNSAYSNHLALAPVNTLATANSSLAAWTLSSSQVAQYGTHLDPKVIAANIDNWTQAWNTEIVPLVHPPA